jgi:hypothetical protein
MKTGVQSTWINKMCEAELFDSSQTLKIRMFDQIEMQFVRNTDKSVNRIIEDFLFVGVV